MPRVKNLTGGNVEEIVNQVWNKHGKQLKAAIAANKLDEAHYIWFDAAYDFCK